MRQARAEALVATLAAGFLAAVPNEGLGAQLVVCPPAIRPATAAPGCVTLARRELGPLPRDTALFWHLDVFQARSSAERAGLGRSTIVEAQGTIWLFTIAPASWRQSTGRRVATIGPLPLGNASALAVSYLQENLLPGMRSPVHRHPGAEARYPLEGEVCLELPTGRLLQKSGSPGPVLPPGASMQVYGVGATMGRTMVLLLEDADKHRAMPAPDWDPTGLCAS